MGKKTVRDSIHVVLLTLLMVGVLVGVVWIVVDALGKGADKTKDASNSLQRASAANIKDADEAFRARQEGRVDELLAYYDRQIEKSDSKDKKHYYHLQKVTVLVNSDRCDDVIRVGKAALDKGVEGSIAESVAECYVKKDDKVNAEKYYQMELESMRKNDAPGVDGEILRLEEIIKTIKGE